MKFMEKIYRAFCADEVKMMLDHMEENFADFQDYDNRWHDLLDAQHYTTLEKAAIKLAYTRLRANQKRQELLSAILRQKIDPIKTKRRGAQVSQSSATISALQTQSMAQQYNYQLAQMAGQYQTQEQYELALQQYKRP